MDAARADRNDDNFDGGVVRTLEDNHKQAARASNDKQQQQQQQQPSIKKRRVDDVQGAATSTSRNQEGADQDEVAKLRNQVQQLKKIACQALCGFKNTVATEKGFFQVAVDVADEWKNDGDLVAAALRGRRVKWWDLPDSLKYDTRVAAVVFVLAQREKVETFGELSVRIPQDVMLAALCEQPSFPPYHHNNDTGSPNWSKVPEDWRKNHRGLALYGVGHQLIDADDCPCLWDRVFMKDRVEKHVSPRWPDLPTELKSDIEFARSIEMFPSPDLPSQILANFPAIGGEREFWKRLVDSAAAFNAKRKYGVRPFVLLSIFQNSASREIRSDRDLMVTACVADKDVMDHVDMSLARDHDFLLACVERNWDFISKIPQELQRLFPDVVDQAVLGLKEEEEELVLYTGLASLAEHLDPMFWADRAFLLRWFENGLPRINRLEFWIPPRHDLNSDAEIFLLIAKYCKPRFLHQYKKRIGEFLHVPTGKRLRLLRQACRNLDDLMEQQET